MTLPYFFIEDIPSNEIQLDEDTSKHMISVLRMGRDEPLLLTNGKGMVANARIIDDNRKKCKVQIVGQANHLPQQPGISIAISLVKNNSRFEWFLEKATEIGINEIIPMVCERTEKEKFRYDRMQALLVSAMLQSQQSWLPVLHQPTEFFKVLELQADEKLIAHCEESEKHALSLAKNEKSKLILIGPEGDFTHDEISTALARGFQPVSLGNTRLRTETAGMVAAALLRQI